MRYIQAHDNYSNRLREGDLCEVWLDDGETITARAYCDVSDDYTAWYMADENSPRAFGFLECKFIVKIMK